MDFSVANKVERIHALLYQKALQNLGDNPELDYYVCALCGNTVEEGAPKKCSIYEASKSEFMKID